MPTRRFNIEIKHKRTHTVGAFNGTILAGQFSPRQNEAKPRPFAGAILKPRHACASENTTSNKLHLHLELFEAANASRRINNSLLTRKLLFQCENDMQRRMGDLCMCRETRMQSYPVERNTFGDRTRTYHKRWMEHPHFLDKPFARPDKA